MDCSRQSAFLVSQLVLMQFRQSHILLLLGQVGGALHAYEVVIVMQSPSSQIFFG